MTVTPGQTSLRSTPAAALVIVVVGMSVFIVQPGFVQGLVEYGGYTERAAGYVAAAEIAGIAFATVALALGYPSRSWPTLARAGLLVFLGGNLVSLGAGDATMLAVCRFGAGLGAGALVSVGYAVIGTCPDPDRGFGHVIMSVLAYSAAVLLLMPTIYAQVGVNGLIVGFALFALAALPAARRLPSQRATGPHALTPGCRLAPVANLCALGAVLSYFLAQGTVWAYLFLFGTSGGVGEQAAATALTVSQCLGIAGAYTASRLAPRHGRLVPASLGILGGILPLLALLGEFDAFGYALAVGVFNYAANVMTPFLMAVIAGADHNGKLIVTAVALQMIGLALGPALGATVIEGADSGSVKWISMSLFALSLALLLPPLRALARTATPA